MLSYIIYSYDMNIGFNFSCITGAHILFYIKLKIHNKYIYKYLFIKFEDRVNINNFKQ